MCANLGNSVILSDIVDKEYLIFEFFFFFFFCCIPIFSTSLTTYSKGK